jgi:(+)-trans-carveol dehydrogenase
MVGTLSGKVAFITGAARGQGRGHALRLAREGASIIALDAEIDVPTVDYPLSKGTGLEETVELVRSMGCHATAVNVDVRDASALDVELTKAVGELGGLDIVIANAGIVSYAPAERLSINAWADVIDINLNGVYYTVRAAIPHILQAGVGGSMVLTSSVLSMRPVPNAAHYIAAKSGVVGLMRALAVELAPHSIRVNSIHPSVASTPMVHNESTYGLFAPHLEMPTRDDVIPAFKALHRIPVPWVEVDDVTSAALYLVSDEARYITGQEFKIDAGAGL